MKYCLTNMAQAQSPTIDEERMKVVTRESINWWDKNSIVKILHNYDELLFDYMKEVLQESGLINNEGATGNVFVLDAGCGGGILSEAFAKLGCTVIGIDVNESVINVAKEHQKMDPSLTNLSYQLQTIEEHAVECPMKYDVVVFNFVLEHVKDHRLLLSSCVQALKPGGILFVSAASKTFIAWFRIVLLGEMIFKYMPSGSHSWRRFISPDDTKTILKENNCSAIACRGFFYDTKTSTAMWISDTKGFYFMYAIKN